MNEEIKIKFYFVNGEQLNIPLNREYLNKLKDRLLKDWDSVVFTGDEWGMNMRHVTHYEIIK